MSSDSLHGRPTSGSFSHLISRIPFVERTLRLTRGKQDIHRFIRYSMVSVVGVAIAEVVILVCTWVLGLSGIAGNTIGCVAATPVSYQLNRRWVWGKGGRSHIWREIVPFWTLTIVGFLASTGTTQWADSMAQAHGVTGLLRSLAIIGASLFAWGLIWIVKFVIFNRLVFVTPHVDEEERLAELSASQFPASTGESSAAALGR